MAKRREVLRSAGLSIVGLSVLGKPAASRENVDKRRRELLSKGEVKKVEALMKDHGLEFSSSTTHLSDNQDTSDGSEGSLKQKQAQVKASMQHRWASPDEDSGTKLNVNISERSNNYEVLLQWKLERERDWSGQSDPCGDAAAVYWADDWQLTDAGRDNLHTNDSRVSYGGLNGVNGIMADVDSPSPGWYYSSEYDSGFYTFVEKIGPYAEDRKIFGEYVHTWDTSAAGGCDGTSVSFSLGPAGISFSGVKKDWEMAASTSL